MPLPLLKVLAAVTRKVHFRGLNRILRLIHDPDSQAGHFEVVMDYHSKLLMHLNTSSFLEWNLFFHGWYEPDILNVIKHLFRPGFAAFDVGAHVGCNTLLMSLYAEEAGQVWAFEPHPSLFSRLLLNLDLNRIENVIPINRALSDVSGSFELFAGAGEVCGQAPSLYRENARKDSTGIRVQTQTLDEIVEELEIRRLDFMKIDTEGNEYKIIVGGRKAIQKHRPHIVFEYDARTWKNADHSLEEMTELLGGMDYLLYQMHKDYLTGLKKAPPKGANILAVPKGFSSTT